MKIAVIGLGAREHAIVKKLSDEYNEVYWINNNNITLNSVETDINNFEKISEFCINKGIELVIPGTEEIIANGITDYLESKGIKTFAPKKEYAFLEASKSESKKFMQRNKIRTPDFKIFQNNEKGIIEEIEKNNGNIVLKYDGLAKGKGVFVSDNKDDALKNMNTLFNTYGKESIFLTEEKLTGKEISIMALVDNTEIKIFRPSMDYKLSHDNNKGYNTGGMGAISPLDFINEEIMKDIKENIIYPTFEGFKKENINYKGFLYFGIILTSDKSYLLEYNIRLGDPETQVLLPAMEQDLTYFIASAIQDKLVYSSDLIFDKKYHMALVLASKGYPLNYETGHEITIKNNNLNLFVKEGLGGYHHNLNIKKNDCDILYAGIKRENQKLISSGGRVLNITASDKDLNKLRAKIYKCAEEVEFKNKYYRTDIGLF